MASLIVRTNGQKTAGAFQRRVLIGRRAFNGVQVEDRRVSRIHAWIDRDGDGFYVHDASSRSGTFVNGQRTRDRVFLKDGDEITVGPARISFKESDELPTGLLRFDIGEDGSNPGLEQRGILIACNECGAPLWVPSSMAGAYGHCAICDAEINVPGIPLTGIRRPLTPNDSIVAMEAITESMEESVDSLGASFPTPQPEAAERICSICQTPIVRGDSTKSCPSCTQLYHAECWRENRGCAAYGCDQMNAMAPSREMIAAALGPPPRAARSVPKSREFPWDFALLGASVFGAIIGAFTFGLPSLAVGATSTVYAIKAPNGRSVAAVSAGICVVGVAVGVVVSRFLWFNLPLWGGR